MTKFKKIAAMVVATVMAGSLVASLTACAGEAKLEVKTDENGKLTYAENTALTFNVGNSKNQSISYLESDISGTTPMIDGKTYKAGDIKPAWAAMASKLKITVKDDYQGGPNEGSSDKQITQPINDKNLGSYDLISGSLSAINQNVSNFVNFKDWLDYMPNFKAFLDSNKVTMYSLTGDANGGMYAAPYYDGNNDIEYYHTIRKDWVEKVLDGTLDAAKFKSFAAQATSKDAYKEGDVTKQHGSIVGTKSAIKPYMGTTGADSYNVESVAEDGTKIFIRLDYAKALEAAKNESTTLGAAIKAAAGEAYPADSTSGNVVDMQNYAIDKTSGAVTGDQLAKIASEYIKAAFFKVDSATATTGTAMYTKASDVFNSVSAAWNVDILASTLRAIVCNNGYLDSDTGDVFGIVARQATSQRRVMLLTMASELYGVRGLGSRLEYIYIGADGELRDCRQNADSFNALNNLSAFAKEGILYTGEEGADGWNSWRQTGDDKGKSKVLGAMSYDYIQTQTKNAVLGKSQAQAGPDYNYAPILVPVSKWDTDDNGSHETIMRFTESWRSVKNTGVCIPIAAVAGNPDKFSAMLTFIDYLYSADGQILMTYGMPSKTDSYKDENTAITDDGFWYAEESDKKLEDVIDSSKTIPGYGNIPTQYTVKSQYLTGDDGVFVYDGKVYKGTEYGGRIVPKITKANDALFKGKQVTTANGTVQQNKGNFKVNQAGSYTNYARLVLGTTLPIGNKNQGFEYQCTADCGRNGASIVDKAITAGVIKHVVVDPAQATSPWYFISPTAYPLTTQNQSVLKNAAQTKIGQYFRNSSKAGEGLNVYLEVMYFGFGTETWLGTDLYILGEEGNGALKADGKAYVDWLNSAGMDTRVEVYKSGWKTLKDLYKIFAS